MKIHINPKFRSVLLPLSLETSKGLESSLIDDGCREPLVLWNGTLVDGHNRHSICQRRGIKFKTVDKEFADEREAMDWILANQMHRRNLTPQEAALIRGRLYEARKNGHGGKRDSSPQSEDLKTSDVIAKEHGVSGATVERDAKFAVAIEALAIVDKDIVLRATRGVEDVNGEVSSVSRSDVLKAAAALESGDKKKAKKILLKPATHVSNNSGEQEWYTPPDFIAAARACMDGIDLDPASCAAANRTVKAKEYFDAKKDGLKQEWHGRVWLNPPYSRPLVEEFCQKLADSVADGSVKQACVLTNNFTETAAGQLLISQASAVLFVTGRISFLDAKGNENGAPLQGQMICGFGVTFTEFKEAFKELGIVLRP